MNTRTYAIRSTSSFKHKRGNKQNKRQAELVQTMIARPTNYSLDGLGRLLFISVSRSQLGVSGVSLTLWCFVVYCTMRFVVCLTLCNFVLVSFLVLLALRLPRVGKRELILALFVRCDCGTPWNFLLPFFAFGAVFQFDNPGISKCLNTSFLLSLYLCFIISFICDLSVVRNNSWMLEDLRKDQSNICFYRYGS